MSGGRKGRADQKKKKKINFTKRPVADLDKKRETGQKKKRQRTEGNKGEPLYLKTRGNKKKKKAVKGKKAAEKREQERGITT